MQTAIASAKMAEAYGYRKHDDSVNTAGLFKNKFHDNSNRRTMIKIPKCAICDNTFKS